MCGETKAGKAKLRTASAGPLGVLLGLQDDVLGVGQEGQPVLYWVESFLGSKERLSSAHSGSGTASIQNWIQLLPGQNLTTRNF